MAVPAKDFPQSWNYDGSYQGSPKRDFLPRAIWGEEVDAEFRKILQHRINCSGLGTLDPMFLLYGAYNTSKADCGELVVSFFGDTELSYVGHRESVRRESMKVSKELEYSEMAELAR